MRAISVLIALAGLLAAADGRGEIMTGTASFRGTIVRFRTMAEPPFKDGQLVPGGISVRTDRVHRFMCDGKTGEYFGYDLVVEPGGAPNRHRVIIEPLSLEPLQLKLGNHVVARTPILLPKYPPPQIVEDGDTIALDLLVSPDGKRKIVDYIEVNGDAPPPPAGADTPARDFTLDDGPLSFTFRSPVTLFINGQQQPGPAMTGRPGGTLWFELPGRGRHILSLAPHEGFEKAGAIRNHAVVFQAGGETFELRTSGPILGKGGAWNLYLLHQPDYPSGSWAHYGTDRLDNLLGKR
jgi:hypothetical protein